MSINTIRCGSHTFVDIVSWSDLSKWIKCRTRQTGSWRRTTTHTQSWKTSDFFWKTRTRPLRSILGTNSSLTWTRATSVGARVMCSQRRRSLGKTSSRWLFWSNKKSLRTIVIVIAYIWSSKLSDQGCNCDAGLWRKAWKTPHFAEQEVKEQKMLRWVGRHFQHCLLLCHLFYFHTSYHTSQCQGALFLYIMKMLFPR